MFEKPMRLIPAALAASGFAAFVGRLLGRRREEANIRLLAERLGCSLEDARRVYLLARERGYGAAHEAVFGPHRPEPSPEEP